MISEVKINKQSVVVRMLATDKSLGKKVTFTDKQIAQQALQHWEANYPDVDDITRYIFLDMQVNWRDHDLLRDQKVRPLLRAAWRKKHPRGNYPFELSDSWRPSRPVHDLDTEEEQDTEL